MEEIVTKYIRAINPSLTEYPRPIDNKTGEDICYHGIGPDDEAIYCKHLPIDMLGSVGSWYISPQRHLVESVLVSLVSLFVLVHLLPKLLKNGSGNGNGNGSVSDTTADLRPASWMKFVSVIALVLQTWYKILGYDGKIYSMMLPCNVLWFLAILLSFYPSSSKLSKPLSETIVQLWFSYIGLPVAALAQPDTTDSIQFGEVYFFFIHHSLLVFFPLYYLYTAKSSTVQNYTLWENVQWILVSCAFFGLFYFGIVAPFSLYVGLNLNYMLLPPAGSGVEGPTYRLQSIGVCVTVFTIMRVLLIVGEILLRGSGGGRSSKSEKAKSN